MKKIALSVVLALICGVGSAPAFAKNSDENYFQAAAKSPSFLSVCKTDTEMNCIDSVSVLEGSSGSEVAREGTEANYKAKVIESCSSDSSAFCDTWEPLPSSGVPHWTVESSFGTLSYVVKGLFKNKKFKNKAKGSKRAALALEVAGFNIGVQSFNPPKVQIKIRTSWLKPSSALYQGREADLQVSKIAGGNLLSFTVVPQEAAQDLPATFENLFSSFEVTHRLPKAGLKGIRCATAGFYMTSSSNGDYQQYRFSHLQLKWSKSDRSLTQNLDKPIILGSTGFVSDDFEFTVDEKYLSCITKKQVSVLDEFTVEVTEVDGSVIQLSSQVSVDSDRLRVVVEDLPDNSVKVVLKVVSQP